MRFTVVTLAIGLALSSLSPTAFSAGTPKATVELVDPNQTLKEVLANNPGCGFIQDDGQSIKVCPYRYMNTPSVQTQIRSLLTKMQTK
jgi:hypothetical protein